jgi:hypothetical protein
MIVARLLVDNDGFLPVVEEVDPVLRVGPVVQHVHHVRPPEDVVRVDAAELLAVASLVAPSRVRYGRPGRGEARGTDGDGGTAVPS